MVPLGDGTQSDRSSSEVDVNNPPLIRLRA